MTMQRRNENDDAVLAIAGRRIDQRGADAQRFPLERIPVVRTVIHNLLICDRGRAVVSSAACGADLLALEEAESLRLPRQIVLPFSRELFRQKSVVDRPGDWDKAFDRLTAQAAIDDNLIILDVDPAVAYTAVNFAIIDEAFQMARSSIRERPQRRLALVVWEGTRRPGCDTTEYFRQLALDARFVLSSILTRGKSLEFARFVAL